MQLAGLVRYRLFVDVVVVVRCGRSEMRLWMLETGIFLFMTPGPRRLLYMQGRCKAVPPPIAPTPAAT